MSTKSQNNVSAIYNIGMPGITLTNGTSTNYTWEGGLKPNSIVVKGDAEFEGNIKWLDRDMKEWFELVETRLGILHPNQELEEEWEELHQIRMQYVEAEKKLLEKQKVFNILKKNST